MVRQRGFTLIEAIMVIAITGIVAAMVAVFMKGPIDAYFDAANRAALTDVADTTLRRLGREVRQSLPNSLRVSGACLEFIPTRDGGRYRSAGAGNILDFTTADSSFDVLGPTVSNQANDFLVVFNTGQCSVAACNGAAACVGANAYEGCNRRQIAAGTAPSLVVFASTAALPLSSPGNRFHVVPASGPVTIACEAPTAAETAAGVQGPRVLHRYTGYASGAGAWNGAAPQCPPSGTPALLADQVATCTGLFNYSSGVTARNGLLDLRLSLTRNGESVSLYHEVHVDNTP